jgi:hypothetical protein
MNKVIVILLLLILFLIGCADERCTEFCSKYFTNGFVVAADIVKYPLCNCVYKVPIYPKRADNEENRP